MTVQEINRRYGTVPNWWQCKKLTDDTDCRKLITMTEVNRRYGLWLIDDDARKRYNWLCSEADLAGAVAIGRERVSKKPRSVWRFSRVRLKHSRPLLVLFVENVQVMYIPGTPLRLLSMSAWSDWVHIISVRVVSNIILFMEPTLLQIGWMPHMHVDEQWLVTKYKYTKT